MVHAAFTIAGWKNFAKSQIGYVHSPRLRFTALHYLHVSKMDIDELIQWYEDNIELGWDKSDPDFNPYHYIDELKKIREDRK